MEEKKKRRGYKTQKEQTDATKRYLERNPEAKERVRISQFRSTCKRYIRNFSNLEELKELESLIKERRKSLK